MLKKLVGGTLAKHHEFQAAVIRLGIWLFAFTYIGLTWLTDYYAVNGLYFLCMFALYLVVFTGLLVSVIHTPDRPGRIYVALLIDITATSLAIFLTREAISPFYLLYIWIFQSYGTRFGRNPLYTSSILSVVAFAVVLTALNEWQRHPFEAVFFLFLLMALPWYQVILLRKLHEARQVAQAADRAKTEFLANMTHEIRTPLNGVVGMAKLLETTELDQEQKGYVDSLQTSARLLHALIGDVLDLSKIDAGQLIIENRAFDLHATVREVGSALAGNAHAKLLELVLDIADDVPVRVKGDETRLRQVLYNLLGNAIKFTQVGEVVVRVRREPRDGPGIRLSIEDTGIGMPPDKLDCVFERFWQADPSNTRRHGGTGLGMTIALNLVKLMNGSIEVESSVGEGTTFTVHLPLLADEEQPVDEPVDFQGAEILLLEANSAACNVLTRSCEHLGLRCRQATSEDQLWSTVHLAAKKNSAPAFILVSDTPAGRDLCEISRRLQTFSGSDARLVVIGYGGRLPQCDGQRIPFVVKPVSREELARTLLDVRPPGATNDTEQPSSAAPAEKPLRPILVAEDDVIGARVIYNLLLKEGYRVTLVKDGRAALEMLHNGGHSLALIDMRMPEMDGLEFTRRHRERESSEEHLPIIALTADASSQSRDACLAAGMDDFLTKPVNREQLLSLIPRYAI